MINGITLAEERVFQSSLTKMGWESPENIISSIKFQLEVLSYVK